MKKVGVRYRGESGRGSYVIVHAVAPGVGDADTLCMEDANDDHYSVGTLGLVEVADDIPINCPACYDIWKTASRYKSKDFLPKGK